jgi:hypothetical protein
MSNDKYRISGCRAKTKNKYRVIVFEFLLDILRSWLGNTTNKNIKGINSMLLNKMIPSEVKRKNVDRNGLAMIVWL